MRLVLAVLSLLALPLTACGDGESEAVPQKTVTVTETVATEQESTAPAEDLRLSLGDKLTISDDTTVQVIEYRGNVPGTVDGGRLDGVLVKACAGSSSMTFSWDPWALLDADSGSYPAAGYNYGDWMTPQYPFAGERTYLAGQCVKGWIGFDVPQDSKFVAVSYGNSAGDVGEWRLR